MKRMYKNGITRHVTDKEAVYLKSNGYVEMVEEAKVEDSKSKSKKAEKKAKVEDSKSKSKKAEKKAEE